MEDDMFNNTIIASIPDIFKPTVNALVVVASKTSSKVTPQELIATIRAEAMGYVKKGQGKKESANYAGNTNRGRGRFRGRYQRGNNFRGRGNNRGAGPNRSNNFNNRNNDSTCYNCGGKGHFANQCPSQKCPQANQAKDTKPELKKNNSNNSNSDNWRNRSNKSNEQASSSSIEEIPESSWAAIDITDYQKHLADNIISLETSIPSTLDDIAASTTHTKGVILFDSGCSTHMTPLKDQLRNVIDIPTRSIQVANAEIVTANTSGSL
jgi:hypothetical protein